MLLGNVCPLGRSYKLDQVTVLFNGKLVSPGRHPFFGEIVIRGSKIVRVGPAGSAQLYLHKNAIPQESVRYLNVRQHTVVPGFIDLHVHGGGGADFMDATVPALRKVASTHARHGTTSLLATTMASDWQHLGRVASTIKESRLQETEGDAEQKPVGAQVLGLHLEGPYLNPKYAGAQPVECFKNPCVEELARFFSKHGGVLKLVTLAPELPGSSRVISYLREKGIRVAAGHSGASWKEIEQVLSKGLNHVAHVFNAMRGLHHREPGLAGAALYFHDLTLEVIADGLHLAPPMLKLLVQCVDPRRLILVSDAVRACDLPAGEYLLGPRKIIVDETGSRLPDGRLAGSILTLDRALANLIRWTDIKLASAVELVSLNPARALGIERAKGSLEPGKDADLVVLDASLKVLLTMVGGRIVTTNFDSSNILYIENI